MLIMVRTRLVSTGLRFTTVPPTLSSTTPGATPSPTSSSPPTTLTLLYNPLIGFVSTSYSASITPHLALSTRFGVNIYSYESDLVIGGEWWIGSGRGKGGFRGLVPKAVKSSTIANALLSPKLMGEDGVTSDLASRKSSLNTSDLTASTAANNVLGLEEEEMAKFGRMVNSKMAGGRSSSLGVPAEVTKGDVLVATDPDERDGVLKCRVSGTGVSG